MKKMYKRIVILSLALFLSLLLAACNNTSVTTNQTTENTTASSQTTASQTTTTLANSNVGIEIQSFTKTEYNIGQAFDYSSVVVVLVKASGSKIPLGSTVYTMTGFNSASSGEITLTFSYLTFSTTFHVTILESNTNLNITMAYYLSAQDLSGQELMDALHTIINTGYAGHVYSDASYAMAVTDRDPNNSNNILLIYEGTSVSSAWDGGNTWNKEHVWPQSLLGEDAGSTVNMASDLHNLKPSEPSINSARGNKYFANTTTSTTFAPRNEVRGDIARILFYMATMYSVLELVDQYPNTYQMGLLSVLLEWNDLDPVDDFERNRNNAIYAYQNNRNPYVDYPQFVDLVWDNLGN